MLKRLTFSGLMLFCLCTFAYAQVQTEPFFPEIDDDVTIYFDASQGNGALAGFSGDIYAHTGVITNESTGPSDWKYVVSGWATTDPNVLMTALGDDRYQLEYNIRDYYGVPMGEEVLQMAFVFRDAAGNIVGRSSDGSDIYTPVYNLNGELETRFITPMGSLVAEQGTDIEVFAVASESADLSLYDNGSLLTQNTSASIEYTISASTSGTHLIEFVANAVGESDTSRFSYFIPGNISPANPPMDSKLGINYTSNTSVLLRLYAPNKNNVLVIGDFNDWNLSEEYQMTPSLDGNTFWLEITDLTPGQHYAFQYLVDGSLKIADPYSTLVLDPNNDGFIPTETFPNLPAYPVGKTTGICAVIQPGATPFDWQNTDFVRPEKTDLVIYELLMRDFVGKQNYQTLLDTLNYLERLGVNAIELMPVNEFEGNLSWGYNPSFHMALDKFYGSPESFKTFVDEAHNRGIAVILDVVYNHAFSQSPFAQLYWDAANFRPTADNPWLNVEATHPFNVGYDFNHESQATKDFVNRVMTFWLTEYRIDGFRFDLSKGFTQTDYGNDVGAWSNYDAGRVAILKRIADEVWTTSSDAYVILEHFANNTEETELSNYGMMIWGNMNHNYNEGSMGFTNNSLTGASYQNRGWDDPHLITYMESHDEERLMYKNLQFGNAEGSYNVQELPTALQRQELVSAFFYTIPGPKMLWQFGEMGYDYSINTCTNGSVNPDCRLDPKPIRWDYLEEAARLDLFHVTKALIDLKQDYPVFKTTDFDFTSNGYGKKLHLNDAAMNVVVLGNFNIESINIDPAFQSTGMWFEYFSGDTLMVSNVNNNLNFLAGEYRLYTDQKLPEPPGGYRDFVLSTESPILAQYDLNVYPNPNEGAFTINYTLDQKAAVQLELVNVLGQTIKPLVDKNAVSGSHQVEVDETLAPGTYFIRLTVDGASGMRKLVVF